MHHIHQYLRQQAETHGGKAAFTFLADDGTQNSLGFRQLDERARSIAAYLQSVHAPGSRFLLLFPAGLEFIATFFGCLYAGMVAVPAAMPSNVRRAQALLPIFRDAGAACVLTTRGLLPHINAVCADMDVGQHLSILASEDLAAHPHAILREPTSTVDSLAFLQYTSGSTGIPRGVMVSHSNVMHNSQLIQRAFALSADSRAVIWLPHFHDMGLIGGILQTIYSGYETVLMSPLAFAQSPARWLQAISTFKATVSGGPNFAYELACDRISEDVCADLDLSNWQVAFVGAEPVRASVLERFAVKFKAAGFRPHAFSPCYGLAESTVFVAGTAPAQAPRIEQICRSALASSRIEASNAPNAQQIVGCGRIGESLRVAIVNSATQAPCAPDELGEIWVHGDSVAQGYWNQAEATLQTFRAHLADDPTTPFLRTGDLGFLHAGELFVAGRLKDMIIRQGRNIYAQDIESSAASVAPGQLGLGACFAIEKDGDEQLVLVQEVADATCDPNAMIGIVRAAIGEAHDLEPDIVVMVRRGKIPRTSSGKVQRRACRDLWLQSDLPVIATWRRQAAAPAVGPAPVQGDTDISTWLLIRAAAHLGVPMAALSLDEPLAQHGFSSLHAARLAGEMSERFRIPLSAAVLYEYPTLRRLGAHLAGLQRPGTAVQGTPTPADETAIAVIGMACRFPGADDLEEFWQLLLEGRDAIKACPEHRRVPGTTHVAGYLDDVASFEAEKFAIAPREAALMDPQQRLLLEISDVALQHAGQAPARLAGSKTGVFVGISNNDYAHLCAQSGQTPSLHMLTGNSAAVAANRISYVFDFRGPSMAVDTACSSSLVAIHQACQSLRRGECNMALAAGVNLILRPNVSQGFASAGALADDGRCKAFDVRADGYVRGEGCGVIVLKPLAAAVADNDGILAIIRGSAVNQDGRSNGLTAPNGLAQQEVIAAAMQNAGVAPEAISYVEAHGTGTPLGDPIEARALARVLEGTTDRPTCFIGSVKTNIGHLEAAAGIAGLIKTVLALQHETLPPHLHFGQLHPDVPFEGRRLDIPRRAQAWRPSAQPRIAGVSSFGFGGTNAHIIVQEAPSQPSRRAPSRSEHTSEKRPGQEHWITTAQPPMAVAEGHPLLGRGIAWPDEHEARFEIVVSAGSPLQLADHQVEGSAVMPAAAYLEMARAAAYEVLHITDVEIAEVTFATLLVLQPGERRRLQCVLRVTGEARANFSILSAPTTGGLLLAAAQWVTHATGNVSGASPAAWREVVMQQMPANARPTDTDALYAAFEQSGIAYGPTFRALRATQSADGSAWAELRVDDPIDKCALYPALLDGWFQLAAAALQGRNLTGPYLPVGVRRLRLHGSTGLATAQAVMTMRAVDAIGGSITCDGRLWSNGACVGEMEGLRLQPMPAPANDLYEIAWVPQPVSGKAGPLAPARWWLVGGDNLLALDIAQRLAVAGHRATLVAPDALDAQCWQPEGVIFLEGLADVGTDEQLPERTGQLAGRALRLVQHLARSVPALPACLWWIVRPQNHADLVQAPLWGLSRVVEHEHPALQPKVFDLADTPATELARTIVAMVLTTDGENHMVLRGGQRLVARLRAAQLAPHVGSINVARDGTYLITGGFGGLGLLVARWLVQHGARHLHLLGHRPPSADTGQVISTLRSQGAQVLCSVADVGDAGQLEAALREAAAQPTLRGVIHCAGLLDDAALVTMTPAQMQRVLGPKVFGTWNLHTATRKVPLDFFVLFSSAAALLGSPGQANHAAANAFCDALAHHRRSLGLPSLSINWGPWAEIGTLGHSDKGARLAARGLQSLTPARGLALFATLLSVASPAQVAAMAMNWQTARRQSTRMPLLDALLPATSQATAPEGAARVLHATGAERTQRLQTYLRDIAAQTLDMRARDINDGASLTALGIDSIMALEMKNRIETDLGVQLPLTKLLAGPSMQELCTLIADLLPESPSAPAAILPGLSQDTTADLLERLDELTDEQVDAMLRTFESQQAEGS